MKINDNIKVKFIDSENDLYSMEGQLIYEGKEEITIKVRTGYYVDIFKDEITYIEKVFDK